MSAQVETRTPQVVDSSEFIDLLDYDLRGDNSTVERKRAFLEAYRVHGVISRATYEARIHRTTVYKWLESDSVFSQAFADCHEDTYDELEASGYQKALAGDPILTMFYLKAHRPKFRDRLQVDVEQVDAEIRQRMRVITGGGHSGQQPAIPSPAPPEQKD